MANQVDEFKYFSYLIIFVLLIYMFILSVFLCVRRNEIRKERDLGLLPYNDDINNEYCAAYRINLTTKFEQIVHCSLGSSITYRIVLMCVRLVLFLYFFIVGAILNGVEKSYAFNYFENWCALLVMMYFLFATTCSIISIHSERSRTEVDRRLNAVSAWTLKVRVLGVCTHLMFEVAGGTSVFVLVMVHFIHGPASEIINAVHYMTFFALLLEMWLNTVRVRFDQYPACAAWLVFYLLVIWPCVFTGVFLTWPYSEMTTQDINCFRNYFVLFLLNFVFYSCWYVLYKMKKLAFVCKDRYYDNRSSVGGSSIGDDSASVASSARGSVYSASWFDNGDDWAYPMATVTTTASTASGPAMNRSLNLQPMGYRSGGGGSGAGGTSVASSTVGDSQYYESHNNYSGGSNNNRSNVNRTLNLQPMGARQSSTSSTDYYGGGGDAYSTQDHHPPAGGSGTTSYNFWNSSGPVRPPVQHNRGLNINPISSYHHTSGNAQRTSVSDNSSDNSFGFFGAGATNDGYYDGQTPQQAPVPPAATEAGYGGDDYYYGGYPSGTPVQRTGMYASPPPPPPAAPTGGSSSSGGYDDYYYTNTSHAHNRGLNINPLSSYHRSSDPPPAPPAPAPVSSGGTWRGYAIGGGNRTSNLTTTSSAGSGIRFPAYSNKPRTNQVDRSLNLNPINQYHQRNTNPNNMSRQFSNTDNDLNAFANFGDDDGAYDVNVG